MGMAKGCSMARHFPQTCEAVWMGWRRRVVQTDWLGGEHDAGGGGIDGGGLVGLRVRGVARMARVEGLRSGPSGGIIGEISAWVSESLVFLRLSSTSS